MTGCLRHVTYDSHCADCRRKRDSDALSDTLLYGMPVSSYVPSDVASDPSPSIDTTPSFDAFDGGSSGGGGATGGWE